MATPGLATAQKKEVKEQHYVQVSFDGKEKKTADRITASENSSGTVPTGNFIAESD